MGACRGLNLVLGLAATATALTTWWPLGLLSATYIAGVTAVSRGEVLGGDRHARRAGLVLVSLAVAALVLISASAPASRWAAATIAGILGWRVLPAYWAAARTRDPTVARRAVRTGVLSLVLLDAALAAAYAGPSGAAAVLAAGVLAGSLARIFAVT
jgi:hypothetical protein